MQLRHLLKSIYPAPPPISIKAYDYTKQRGGISLFHTGNNVYEALKRGPVLQW